MTLDRVSSAQIICAEVEGESAVPGAEPSEAGGSVAEPLAPTIVEGRDFDGGAEGLAAACKAVPGPSAHPASSTADKQARPIQVVRASWGRILLFMVKPFQNFRGPADSLNPSPGIRSGSVYGRVMAAARSWATVPMVPIPHLYGQTHACYAGASPCPTVFCRRAEIRTETDEFFRR